MCGLEAAAVALEQGLPAGYEGALVGYSRSGDRDGDYSLSVSYASILLCAGTGADTAPEGGEGVV
jgi:AmmeMemoRadiSam system protein B